MTGQDRGLRVAARACGSPPGSWPRDAAGARQAGDEGASATPALGQQQLQRFREELGAKLKSPFNVLLKERKLPMSLLNEGESSKKAKVDLLKLGAA